MFSYVILFESACDYIFQSFKLRQALKINKLRKHCLGLGVEGVERKMEGGEGGVDGLFVRTDF